MINLLAKFEACIFSRSRDIRGSRNIKSRSRDQATPLLTYFSFCALVCLTFNRHAKLKVCIVSHYGYITGVPKFEK